MQLISLRLGHVLLITAVLYTTEALTAGCEDWNIQGREVCCMRCRPGNHLVEHCGPDHSTLCTPCEPNTYAENPLAPHCRRCTQCIDPQVQLKPCNASADTVCGCKPGFRCGNQQCAYCIKECTKGQEPTDERDCRKCPEGTFNDEIHSACKPWRERCPEGVHIIARGNEFSDIKCGRIPETASPQEINTMKNTKRTKTDEERTKTDDNAIYPLIGFFAGSCALMFIIILLLWFAYRRARNKSKSKDAKPSIPTQGELTVIRVEHEEACSFHQPEQEQGGSSESINTQGSETKLIV